MTQNKMFVYIIIILTIFICVILIYFNLDPPNVDRPWNANVIYSNSSCASAYCQAWVTYSTSSDIPTIIHFYQQKGYQCSELSSGSALGSFADLEFPYWQCEGKAFPKGNAVVGFKTMGQSTITVYTMVGWDPGW